MGGLRGKMNSGGGRDVECRKINIRSSTIKKYSHMRKKHSTYNVPTGIIFPFFSNFCFCLSRYGYSCR